MLADVVIAHREEALLINAAGGRHWGRWQCLDSKRMDMAKLSDLSQILSNRPTEGVETARRFVLSSLVDEFSDEGPWLYLFPPLFQAALAELHEMELQPIAEKWVATPAIVAERWSVQGVGKYLRALVSHALQAQQAGKSLFLWHSL